MSPSTRNNVTTVLLVLVVGQLHLDFFLVSGRRRQCIRFTPPAIPVEIRNNHDRYGSGRMDGPNKARRNRFELLPTVSISFRRFMLLRIVMGSSGTAPNRSNSVRIYKSCYQSSRVGRSCNSIEYTCLFAIGHAVLRSVTASRSDLFRIVPSFAPH
jgi:hypothetical protein